jgi:phage anti-repressor protein
MIHNSKDLDELHKVWEQIKQYNLWQDETIMSWYDFKYNLIGNI